MRIIMYIIQNLLKLKFINKAQTTLSNLQPFIEENLSK